MSPIPFADCRLPAAARSWAPRALAVALLVAGLGPAAAASTPDPYRAHLFSRIDRAAVPVGGLVEWSVEALAVPTSDAARAALTDAFEALAPVAPGLEEVRRTRVMSRETGGVVELQRRFVMRVTDPALAAVPAVVLRLAGATDLATRPHRLHVYRESAALAAAARSVVALEVDGQVGTAGFTRRGSAFLAGPDALVTAFHVVAGARRITARLADGRTLRVREVWALDPSRDVAVLAVDPDDAREAGLDPLAVAPARAASPVAVTAGWPGAVQWQTVAPRYDDLVLDGGQRLRVAANPVRPGDSGGPLLAPDGRVLGVVVSGRATVGAPNLLREDICLAADPHDALAHARALSASGAPPVALGRALRDAARQTPEARVFDAAVVLQLPPGHRGRAPHVAALLDALDAAPADPSIQYLAGSALEDAGALDPARAAFQAAWAGGYVPAAYALAHHHLTQGNAEAARRLFDDVRLAPAYAHLGALGVAQASVLLGEYDAAEVAVDDVLDHDPRFGPALYLLGVIRVAQGRPEEAAALRIRLGPQAAWAEPLTLLLTAPALQPEALRPLPRGLVSWRRY